MKHTQGPWCWVGFYLWGNNGETVLEVGDDGSPLDMRCTILIENDDKEKAKANRMLIAAAPDLLDALEACIQYGAMTGDDWVVEKAGAAIAKATGGNK